MNSIKQDLSSTSSAPFELKWSACVEATEKTSCFWERQPLYRALHKISQELSSASVGSDIPLSTQQLDLLKNKVTLAVDKHRQRFCLVRLFCKIFYGDSEEKAGQVFSSISHLTNLQQHPIERQVQDVWYDAEEDPLLKEIDERELQPIDREKKIAVPYKMGNVTGCACFLNACNQVLLQIKSFRDLIQRPLVQEKKEDDEHFQARQEIQQKFIELINAVELRREINIRKAILGLDRAVKQSKFSIQLSEGGQQDGGAYLELLLDEVLNIHFTSKKIRHGTMGTEERSREYPPETHVLWSVAKDDQGENRLVDVIQSGANIMDVESAVLTEDDGKTIFCISDKEHVVLQEPLPEVFVVRLLNSFVAGNYKKNSKSLAFEEDGVMDLSGLCGRPSNSPGCQYQVKGLVQYSGANYYGHYTSYVKDEAGQWHYCNDATVHPVDFEEVLRASGSTYLFCLEKISSE